MNNFDKWKCFLNIHVSELFFYPIFCKMWFYEFLLINSTSNQESQNLCSYRPFMYELGKSWWILSDRVSWQLFLYVSKMYNETHIIFSIKFYIWRSIFKQKLIFFHKKKNMVLVKMLISKFLLNKSQKYSAIYREDRILMREYYVFSIIPA